MLTEERTDGRKLAHLSRPAKAGATTNKSSMLFNPALQERTASKHSCNYMHPPYLVHTIKLVESTFLLKDWV